MEAHLDSALSGLQAGGVHASGPHAATRLGVPPPPVQARPRVSRPQPAAVPPKPARSVWLVVAVVLAMVAAVALVAVLAM